MKGHNGGTRASVTSEMRGCNIDSLRLLTSQRHEPEPNKLQQNVQSVGR